MITLWDEKEFTGKLVTCLEINLFTYFEEGIKHAARFIHMHAVDPLRKHVYMDLMFILQWYAVCLLVNVMRCDNLCSILS